MRLKFNPFDGRGYHYELVIDQDTGNEVGYVKSNGVGTYCSGGIDVSLFDGKYTASLSRYETCLGFVKGVEAVLNHMIAVERRATTNSASEAA